MKDFEKLGVFYLGRPYDLAGRGAPRPGEGWILYDSSDLLTHAVCVGMTGSGKTGLCIGIIEEAAIDGIPSLVIDPKGDLSNLLLTFPDLAPADFRPWINEEEARAKNVPPAQYAEQQAALWKKGLAEWGQDGERIRRLRAAADFAIYTPGSSAGLPVSVLKSLAPPPGVVLEDSESLQEQIGATATGLLGLLGIDADPLKSREHILVSTLLGSAWKERRSLDLPALISQIQDPPVRKVGVLDLESFFPAKERFGLAMSINNLLASPGFEAWLEGEPLDVGRMLHGPEGKPRVSIFSLAHLGDAERMFFVSFLLNRTIGWMRSQSGTGSLRALLYMDEIFGYFPPVANPPSKLPLLSLLKQARAFGLGIVLATQNPVDLDYKGLSNAGTWLIGRLQTERDKSRLLDGLEGAAAGAGSDFDRKRMDTILSGLGSRIFLMNNVHDDEPVVFQTRWTMSYLRGPLTREQIRQLMAPQKRQDEGRMAEEERSAGDDVAEAKAQGANAAVAAADAPAGAGAPGAGAYAAGATSAGAKLRRPNSPEAKAEGANAAASAKTVAAARGEFTTARGAAVPVEADPETGSAPRAVPTTGRVETEAGGEPPTLFRADLSGDEGPRPVLPPAVPQFFVTVRGDRPGGSGLVYQPVILGSVQVRYVDKKAGVDAMEEAAFATAVTEGAIPVDWSGAVEADFRESDLERTPEEGALFGSLPDKAAKAASYEVWGKDFAAWLVRTRKLDLLRSRGTGEVSRPAETERDFRIRLGEASREKRDALKEQLQQKYAPRIAALTERVRRAEQTVEREAEQAQQQKMQTAISVGATLLGSLFGRRAIGMGTLGRATTAARGVGRTMKESEDVGRAQETVEALKGQIADLEGELQAELQEMERKIDPLSETFETVTVRPARKDVSVRLVALVWTPYRRDASGALTPAWR